MKLLLLTLLNWLRMNCAVAAAPVAIGSAVAYSQGSFDLLRSVISYLLVLSLSMFCNFAGYYTNFKRYSNLAGISQNYSHRAICAKGSQKTIDMVKLCMLTALILYTVLLAILVLDEGKEILFVGCALIIATFLFCTGPYPLADKGLGEVASGLGFGLLGVCGSYYLQAGYIQALACIAAIPVGLMTTAIMVIRNLENFDLDKRTGKRTLVQRLGRYNSIVCYQVLVGASFSIPVGLALLKEAGAFILLPLCTLPMARSLIIKVACDLEYNLRQLHASSCRLTLVFSLMFGVGFIYRL